MYDDDVTINDVLIEYERRLSAVHVGIAQARTHHTAAAAVFAIAAVLFLILGLYAVRKEAPVWWPSLPVPLAAASARLYGQYRQAASRMFRLRRFYDRAIQRLQGDWPGNGPTSRNIRKNIPRWEFALV